MRVIRWIFVSCFSLSIVGQTLPAIAAERVIPDKQKLEAFIRNLELLDSSYKVIIGDPKPSSFADYDELPVQVVAPRMTAALRYFLSKDGQRLIQGSLLDVSKSPFQEQLSKLTTDLQPSFGSSTAPVQIVIFADFQCPVCKQEANIVRQQIPEKYPQTVRVFFKDFPWENEHKWAKPAAIAGRCILKQNQAAFWAYHDWVYKHQEEFTPVNFKDKVLGYAKSTGLDQAQLERCAENKMTEAEVDKEVTEARSLQVNRTPTLFINGRELSGEFDWDALDRIIKYELKGRTDSGEIKPCSITNDGCSMWPPR